MAEKLGKIEKPLAENYKKGRKLFFVPLLYGGAELPAEYLEKFNKYWEQVEAQIANLELKLGAVQKIYHELIGESGEAGVKVLKELSEKSYQVVQKRLEKGARLQAIEDSDILAEFMDWSRCLSIGLRHQKVIMKIYESYQETGKRRDESITKRLDESLKADELGILFMAEGQKIQFPADIQVFYVAPPALDEIKRWLRDYETRPPESEAQEHEPAESKSEGK